MRTLHDPEDMGPLPSVHAAWSAWAAAEQANPEAGAALMLHPQVGSWAAYTLRRKRGRVTSATPLWVDAGVLHSLALVATARAGLSWRTAVPVRDGTVMLPTMGMALLGDPSGPGVAAATCVDGRVRLECGEHTVVVPTDATQETDRWWPVRRLRVEGGHPLSLLLDDIDPFRELADPVAPERLPRESLDRWTRLLEGAWAILCRDHAETAQALGEAVVSLVPLPTDEWGTTRSASTGEAFASVMISPPVDEVDLAVSLVHEFQHIKLGGLLHLLPMTGPEGEATHHAPWRDDPRPLAGLVQGVYAFFGIADFWRVRRHVSTGAHRRIADFEFAYARGQVAAALAELGGSAGLTDLGRMLVTGLEDRLRSWRTEPLDPLAAACSEVLCASHRAEWRLRFMRPDTGQVRLLANGWLARKPVVLDAPRTSVVPGLSTLRWSLGWQELARRHLVGRAGESSAEDVAVLSGDHELAGEGYRRALAADPGDVHAWAGLSLTASEHLLRSQPEWVHAVAATLRSAGEDVDPVALARWLDGAVPS